MRFTRKALSIPCKGRIQMKVKFLDLAAQNREIQDRVAREFAAIHERTAYIGGAVVENFEREFAEFLGVRHVVGVGSGTDALRLALLAAGIGPGDEVITVPMTFIATVAAIVQTGARPVFVDIDPDSCNISVARLEHYLRRGLWSTPNGPRAILPVHLYGLPAPMGELRELAARYGLRLIEDACQAHGARVKVAGQWMKAGAAGDAGCFSFYPGKNLGAWGEGGAFATNDDAMAAAVALLRDHGRASHYAHDVLGYNARLDALQAGVLRAKLERLAQWNERRRTLAARYCELLSGCDLVLPHEPEGMESCYHLFVVRSPRRDAIRQSLLRDEIECGIHYPVPLHLQPACRHLSHRAGDFPVSEEVARTALSLPIYPHLSFEQQDAVVAAVRRALAEV